MDTHDLLGSGDEAQGSVPDAGNAFDEGIELVRTGVLEAVDAAGATARDLRDAAEQTIADIRETLPTLDDAIDQAMMLPGVPIDRMEFLGSALAKYPPAVVDEAMRSSPALAGIPPRKLSRIAGKALGREARRTTVASMAAGLPGVAAAPVTIPADLVQMYGHLIRGIQILSYVYGWGDLCCATSECVSATTRRALVIFLGAMAGMEQAEAELARLAPLRRTALIAPAVDNSQAVAPLRDALSLRMAHRLTGQVVGKTIPLAGAIISGTISYGGFSDMWKRLRKVLADLG